MLYATRSLWVLPAAFYTVLVTAFGWGVWGSGGRNRALRIAGGLIVVYGALGLDWPFAPMHLREAVLDREPGDPSDVWRVDVPGCAPNRGQSTDAAGWSVGAHQHQAAD